MPLAKEKMKDNAAFAKLPPKFIQAILLLESHVFPIAFLFLAVMGISYYPAVSKSINSFSDFIFIALHPLIAILFNVMCGFCLLLRSNLKYVPDHLSEVLVPLLGMIILILLPISMYLPSWLTREILYPIELRAVMVSAGAVITLLGGLLCLYSLSYLKRNFSIFVEVRTVVLRGPYRYIRHPMYAGEIAMVAGLLLVAPYCFGILILTALIILQYCRGRMEEMRLGDASPQYAKRLSETGMFFPKFGPRQLTGSSKPSSSGSF